MKVKIHSGEAIIGEGELIHFDRGMGVARGSFAATPLYDSEAHAYQIGVRYNPAGEGSGLVAQGPAGPIDCAGVAILDAFEELGEREVSLLGVVEFERHFGRTYES